MIITLLILFCTSIINIIITFLIALWVPGIVFVIVDVLFLWAVAWSLAVIGDSVGTKRACGLTFVSVLSRVHVYQSIAVFELQTML